jgi:hypothetical protein
VTDVKHNGLWMDGWGDEPAAMPGKLLALKPQVLAAPKLIPLYGNRYVVDASNGVRCPAVLTVLNGADIEVAADTFTQWLAKEFDAMSALPVASAIGLLPDSGDVPAERIPFWGELITAYALQKASR